MKHHLPRVARFLALAPKIEKRSDATDELASGTPVAEQPEKIVGMAARYFDPKDDGTEYRTPINDDAGQPTGWTLRERIMPGAFDGIMGKSPDVVCAWQHDLTKPLGRTANGTLRLSAVPDGLRYECVPPNTSWGRDAVESIRRGDVCGSSFRFKADGQTFREDEGRRELIRSITSFRKLGDVSPVTNPAYTGAGASIREEGEEADEETRKAIDKLNKPKSTTEDEMKDSEIRNQIAATLANSLDETRYNENHDERGRFASADAQSAVAARASRMANKVGSSTEAHNHAIAEHQRAQSMHKAMAAHARGEGNFELADQHTEQAHEHGQAIASHRNAVAHIVGKK